MKTPDQQMPAPPLTGRTGLDLLKASSAKVAGIKLTDFLQTPEGREAMNKKKIVLAGPPRSGKSCLRQGLKDVIKQISNGEVYPYVLTACPDGEGAWFQESMNNNPELAAKLKAEYKSKFSPEFTQRVADSVKNLSLPLSFIDIGGVISPENRKICEHANGAIFICGETAAKSEAVVEWKRFFTELGIPIVAEVYSDYKGSEDVVDGIDEDGMFRGSVHHLERGENLMGRQTIQGLSRFIINLGREERHSNAERILTKEDYVRVAIENLKKTSRTARGVVDTSASPDKKENMAENLTGDVAANRAVENFTSVIEFLYEHRNDQFETPEKLREFIEKIAKQINAGIIKEGVLIRNGEDSIKFPYTKTSNLEQAMQQFYANLFFRLKDTQQDPQELAAFIEYHIDPIDHFFADGCSKVAKAISAWSLMRKGLPLPRYRNRDEYYSNARLSKLSGDLEADTMQQWEQWLTYYKSLF